MRDLVPVDPSAPPPLPDVVALGPEAPRPAELFAFMAESELRFSSLRMRIVQRLWNARGEDVEIIEVAIRHPGLARVVRRRQTAGVSRDYDVWVTDGQVVKTLDARSGTASVRPVPRRVSGATDPGLPGFSQVRVPRTPLPPDTVAETFVHPRGFCRNVLATGLVTMMGSLTLVRDREAILLRCDHPRTSHLLTDRPDRWLEVGVDRATGLIVLLADHIGERLTRHAEVDDLELDPSLPDETFTVHLSTDIQMIY
ncbi:MAG: hypothetical protein M3452_04200 [Chloroflexota bacterium]|nr:hypothetical protein [Chloroflexota bacterium]